MTQSIRITIGEKVFAAELNESPTAQQITSALPIEASGNVWGDEIYFSIPVRCQAEPSARPEFKVGELGYCPLGNAFCIFYGPTLASRGLEPVMANPGNLIGRITDDVTPLEGTGSGVTVRIELA